MRALNLHRSVKAHAEPQQQKLQQLGFFCELARLQSSESVPKYMQVDKSAEYGFACIRLDLRSLGVDPSHARFVELDAQKEKAHLHLEVFFNMDAISRLSDEQLQSLTYSELRADSQGLAELRWTQPALHRPAAQYASLCTKAIDRYYSVYSARKGQDFASALEYVCHVLKFLTCQCYSCLRPHKKAYLQMQECHLCKEDFLKTQRMAIEGDILAEIKRSPEIALFLVSTAHAAFKSRTMKPAPYPRQKPEAWARAPP